MYLRFVLAFTLASLFGEGVAKSSGQAPEADAPGLPAGGLSQTEAVRLALTANPDLRAFRKQRAVAEGQIVSATALSNPTLELQALHIQEKVSANLGWSAALKWMPPQPVEWLARRAQARAQLDEVRQEIAEREWALASAVRMSYTTLLELDEQRGMIESALTLRRRIAELVGERVSRGASTRLEQNLANLAVLQAAHDLDDVAMRKSKEQASLRAQLGVVSTEPIVLADSLAAGTWDQPPPEPQALVRQALASRPALRAAQARIAAQEQAVRIEQSRRWPWFDVVGRYRRNDSAGYPSDGMVGIDLTLPILNTNAGPLKVAQAQRELQKALAVAQVQSLMQSIYAACAELKVHRSILERFHRELLPLLHEHERLMEIAARGAALDLVALLSSEESVLRQRRAYSDARLAYRQAFMSLQAAIGVPLKEWIP